MNKKNLIIACLLLLCLFSLNTPAQDTNIFSPENTRIEIESLKQLSPIQKQRLKKTVALLNAAILTASVSSDFNEIASDSMNASKAVVSVERFLPNGALKGSLKACSHALDDSFILRVAASGALDLQDPLIEQKLEEIMLHYQLTDNPAHERPAKVIAFGRVSLEVAKKIVGTLLTDAPRKRTRKKV